MCFRLVSRRASFEIKNSAMRPWSPAKIRGPKPEIRKRPPRMDMNKCEGAEKRMIFLRTPRRFRPRVAPLGYSAGSADRCAAFADFGLFGLRPSDFGFSLTVAVEQKLGQGLQRLGSTPKRFESIKSLIRKVGSNSSG